MAIAEQISRISNAADIIKKKAVELGLTKDDTVDSAGVVGLSDVIDIQSRAIDKIVVKNAETIVPGIKDQTISGGQYLSGTQTIKAVSLDIDANSVLKGSTVSVKSNNETIVSVNGSLDVNYYMTGSTAPDSTVGDVGDYFVVI
jgi:hypothetical protein